VGKLAKRSQTENRSDFNASIDDGKNLRN